MGPRGIGLVLLLVATAAACAGDDTGTTDFGTIDTGTTDTGTTDTGTTGTAPDTATATSEPEPPAASTIAPDEPSAPGGPTTVAPTAPPTGAPTTTTEPPPPPGLLPVPPAVPRPPVEQFDGVGVRIEPALDLRFLTGMRWNPVEDAYYAITQDGLVHRVDRDLNASDVVLDLRPEVTERLPGSERGLLGIAFDPFDNRMVLHFTDRSNHTNVVTMAMVDGRPDPASRQLVLYQEQPGLGHQGGALHYDADGHLYIALGDGGGSRGRDAQDLGSLHGSILRIRPHGDSEGYEIPVDNPFVGRAGHREEIWVSGLRNPWQFSIDRATGDVWIGDVGEDASEEVNVVPAGTSGQNFGWFWFEGSRDRGIAGRPDPAEFTPPIHEYDRSVGVSVIGGVVYHGSAIPELTGAYVFADMTGPLFALGENGSARLDVSGSGVITSFVETPDLELLITTLERGVFRLLPA